MSVNPQRTAACLSDWALDRHVTQESTLDQAAQAHLRTCPRCFERLARFEANQRAFALQDLASAPAARSGSFAPGAGGGAFAHGAGDGAVARGASDGAVARGAGGGAFARDGRTFAERAGVGAAGRSGVRGGVYAALSAAALAAAGFLALRPGTAPDVVRTKGGAQIGFYVKRGERVFEGADSAQLAPGDELRFRYSAASAGWLAILGRDAARRVSVYYPANERMAEAPAGEGQLLPDATQLDDSRGAEQILGVFCDHAHDLAALRSDLARDSAAAPSGCTLHTLHVTKQAAP